MPRRHRQAQFARARRDRDLTASLFQSEPWPGHLETKQLGEERHSEQPNLRSQILGRSILALFCQSYNHKSCVQLLQSIGAPGRPLLIVAVGDFLTRSAWALAKTAAKAATDSLERCMDSLHVEKVEADGSAPRPAGA
jgi:hypothetical protein